MKRGKLVFVFLLLFIYLGFVLGAESSTETIFNYNFDNDEWACKNVFSSDDISIGGFDSKMSYWIKKGDRIEAKDTCSRTMNDGSVVFCCPSDKPYACVLNKCLSVEGCQEITDRDICNNNGESAAAAQLANGPFNCNDNDDNDADGKTDGDDTDCGTGKLGEFSDDQKIGNNNKCYSITRSKCVWDDNNGYCGTGIYESYIVLKNPLSNGNNEISKTYFPDDPSFDLSTCGLSGGGGGGGGIRPPGSCTYKFEYPYPDKRDCSKGDKEVTVKWTVVTGSTPVPPGCKDGGYSYKCDIGPRLVFFTLYNLLATILVLIVIYVIYLKFFKKDNADKVKRSVKKNIKKKK